MDRNREALDKIITHMDCLQKQLYMSMSSDAKNKMRMVFYTPSVRGQRIFSELKRKMDDHYV